MTPEFGSCTKRNHFMLRSTQGRKGKTSAEGRLGRPYPDSFLPDRPPCVKHCNFCGIIFWGRRFPAMHAPSKDLGKSPSQISLTPFIHFTHHFPIRLHFCVRLQLSDQSSVICKPVYGKSKRIPSWHPPMASNHSPTSATQQAFSQRPSSTSSRTTLSNSWKPHADPLPKPSNATS